MNKSLSDKFWEAFELAIQFDYQEGFDEKDYDIVSMWQDGLMQKFYENMTTGRCSLNDFISFDVERFEGEVDKHIARMQEMLRQKENKIII